MLKTESQRCDWLIKLSERQIRALACQRKLSNWQTEIPAKLIRSLESIEGVEIPVAA